MPPTSLSNWHAYNAVLLTVVTVHTMYSTLGHPIAFPSHPGICFYSILCVNGSAFPPDYVFLVGRVFFISISLLTFSTMSIHGWDLIPKVRGIKSCFLFICVSHNTWQSVSHIRAFRKYLVKEWFTGTHVSFQPLPPCTRGHVCRAARWVTQTQTISRLWSETAVGCTWPRCICWRTWCSEPRPV